MKLNKIRLSKEATNQLRFLSGRTGLTPNLLCRLGFSFSLGELQIPNPDDYPEEDREFNRYTLLGEYDALFVALLKQRCHADGLDPSTLPEYFRAHLHRGITLLQRRVRGLTDLIDLVPIPSKTSS